MNILQAGELRQATPEEIASIEATTEQIRLHKLTADLQSVRAERNALLAQTDWTTLPDSPLSAEKKAEYQVYRQALRDMMDGLENAEDAVFPDKPE